MILREPLDERQVQDLHTAYHELEAEVERLRAEKEAFLGAYPRVRELEQEVERLEETLHVAADRENTLRLEVERLRAFVEQQAELGRQ